MECQGRMRSAYWEARGRERKDEEGGGWKGGGKEEKRGSGETLRMEKSQRKGVGWVCVEGKGIRLGTGKGRG